MLDEILTSLGDAQWLRVLIDKERQYKYIFGGQTTGGFFRYLFLNPK